MATTATMAPLDQIGSHASGNYRNYRVQDVPESWNKNFLEEFLRKVLELPNESSVEVHSLAPEPCEGKTQVATFSISEDVSTQLGSYHSYPLHDRDPLRFDHEFVDFTPLSGSLPATDCAIE
jgi:hypothetical protein